RRSGTGDKFLAERIPFIKCGEKRSGPIRSADVHVDSSIEKHSRRFEIMLLHVEQKRVLPALVAGPRTVIIPRDSGFADSAGGWSVDSGRDLPDFRGSVNVCAMIQQQPGCFRMSARPHQSRLTEFLLTRVNLRAAIEQRSEEHTSELQSL